MEPVSGELLSAMAGSVGTAAGQQVWSALRDLLRRPGRRTEPAGPSATEEAAQQDPSWDSSEASWAALTAAPDDAERAGRLAAVLAARAGGDPEFERAVLVWLTSARQVLRIREVRGDVHNTVGGGRQDNVVQTRDVSGGITFGARPSDRG